jgi:hypothetical protein
MALSPINWKRSTLLVVIGLLIIAPLLADYLYSRSQARQDQRDDELVQRYECEPRGKCVADFDGDGVTDNILVGERDFVIKVADREMLRMPYDYIDGTLRPHFAIITASGKSRFLIYDGSSHQPPLKATFAWDGVKLQPTQASDLEWQILSAMAAHDDTGGWSERAFRPLVRSARLLVYYFALVIVGALVFFKRYRAHVSRST